MADKALNGTALTSASDPGFDTIISCVIFILVTSSVTLNSVLISTIVKLRSRRKNRANPTMILILSLAVSDMMYSLLPMLMSGISLANERRWGSSLAADIVCNVSGMVFSVTVRVSILIVLLISITRVVAILFPIKYRRLTSTTRLYTILGAVWSVPVVISILPFFKGVRYNFIDVVALCNWSVHEVFTDEVVMVIAHVVVMVVPFLVPGLIILCLYVFILISVVKLKWMTRSRKNNLLSVKRANSLTPAAKDKTSALLPRISRDHHTKADKVTTFRASLKASFRVDHRLKELVISTCVTLILVGMFCVCYLCWWALSIDFLIMYVRQLLQPTSTSTLTPIMNMFDLGMSGYLRFIIMAYVSILASANINPIIHILAVQRLGLRPIKTANVSPLKRIVRVSYKKLQRGLSRKGERFYRVLSTSPPAGQYS